MDQPTVCAACGGQLRMRLGQLECVDCGLPASTAGPLPGTPAATLNHPYTHTNPAEDFQYFSRQQNVIAKRWAVGLFAFLNLFPSLLLAAIIYWGLTWLRSTDPAAPPDPEIQTMATIIFIVLAVTFVLDTIGVLIFYVILFSDILWLKWLCLVWNAYGILSSFALLFVPERVLSGKDYETLHSFGAVTAGWIVVFAGLVSIAWAWWMVRLVWPDIRGMQLNRRLRRRYA